METVSVGITKALRINTKSLKELKNVLEINDPWGHPMAVLIPYDYYLKMQAIILWAQAREIDKEMNNA